MTKTYKTSTEIICNRCGYSDNWVEGTPDYLKWEWSEVLLGGDKYPIRMDMCPSCTREIKAWIRNGK